MNGCKIGIVKKLEVPVKPTEDLDKSRHFGKNTYLIGFPRIMAIFANFSAQTFIRRNEKPTILL